jgi:cytochrome c-type biogenesis protein CcmE
MIYLRCREISCDRQNLLTELGRSGVDRDALEGAELGYSKESSDMRIRSRFFVGAGLIAVAVGYLIYAAIQSTSEYYMTVNEVAARHATLGGQALRVAGRVSPGTISWDPVTLTLKFGIYQIPDADDDGAVKKVVATVPPVFEVTCVGQPKPDMFAANKDVIVEGHLDGAGGISATQVMTSCPSKYKPKVKQ